jgi:abortive infection bacteriophage resistance protein
MAKYINIEGNQVIDLTPDYNRPLALVDITVLNKLTQLLPKEYFSSIRHNFREQIMKTINLEELVQTSEDFISFHRSVNLIREICQGEIHEVDVDKLRRGIGKFEMEDL